MTEIMHSGILLQTPSRTADIEHDVEEEGRCTNSIVCTFYIIQL